MADTMERSKEEISREKKRLKDEKKKIKQEQGIQKKEAKKRAKEISKQEAELTADNEGSPIGAFLVTVIIIVIWLAILALLIKLDVGGFGSNVLKPILKDVPVINLILPGEEEETETEDKEGYYGYTSLGDAVDQIKSLEKQLAQMQQLYSADEEKIAELEAEVNRLAPFEENQLAFAKVKQEFYENVIYAEKGPGYDAYIKYYESMDPTTAEYLYKQVIIQKAKDKELEDYANTYSAMKPKAAAGIFEAMTDDLELVAKILEEMGPDSRGAIMAAMDPAIAAKLTKIMDPDQ